MYNNTTNTTRNTTQQSIIQQNGIQYNTKQHTMMQHITSRFNCIQAMHANTTQDESRHDTTSTARNDDTTQHDKIRQHNAMHYFIYIIMQCDMIQFFAIQYNTIRYDTTHNTTIQYRSIQYNTI